MANKRSCEFAVVALVALLALGPHAAGAQPAVVVGAQQKTLRMVRASAPPVIDGVLDDPVWQDAAVVDDLHEIQPIEYNEPSERTVVYVLYEKGTGVNLMSALYGLVVFNNLLALALALL